MLYECWVRHLFTCNNIIALSRWGRVWVALSAGGCNCPKPGPMPCIQFIVSIAIHLLPAARAATGVRGPSRNLQIVSRRRGPHNRWQPRLLSHAPIILCLYLVYWRVSLTLSVTGEQRVAISGPWDEPGTALGANQGSIDGKLPLLLLGTIDAKAAPVCAAACCDLADHDCCALFRFWGDKLRENWGSKRRR